MKKIILAFSLCLTVLIANAQQTKEQAEFGAYSQAAEQTAHENYQKKDYSASVSGLKEWLTRYEQLSSGMKKYFQGYVPGIYYNLACYEALAGQKADAISSFEKAADSGYKNYTNTLSDSDLESLRNDERFKAALLKIREKGDYGYILQTSGPYNHKNAALPVFTYQSANAPELIALKNKFNLDSISGNGDEISKFKNLLHWAHNSVRHDGNSNNPPSRNAADLIAVCKKENRGVNCRMMATILRDAYQAEGFKRG
jgi:hypothetical protein